MATKTRTAETTKFSDRVRFNWGYHDAASDYRRRTPRTLIEVGRQDPKTVSREFDAAYYDGYSWGINDEQSGAYVGNSTAAWLANGGNPAEA